MAYSRDLPRVKSLTMGRPLIMGRRTFQSIGRALPGRANIVLTRQANWSGDGRYHGVISWMDAIAAAEEWIAADTDRTGEIVIFGGGEIYSAFMPHLDVIDLTEVHLSLDDAALFPNGMKPTGQKSRVNITRLQMNLSDLIWIRLERTHHI